MKYFLNGNEIPVRNAIIRLEQRAYLQGYDVDDFKAYLERHHKDDMDGEEAREWLQELEPGMEIFLDDLLKKVCAS